MKSCLGDCCFLNQPCYARVRFHKLSEERGNETDTGKEIGFGLWGNSRLDRGRHNSHLSPSERNQDEPGLRNGGEYAHARNLQKLAEGPESDAEQRAPSHSRGNRNGQAGVRAETFR